MCIRDRINVVSDRALLGAFTREEHRVGAAFIRQAASEVYGRPIPAPWLRWATAGAVVAALALIAFGAWSLFGRDATKNAATKSPVVAAASSTAPATAPVVAPQPVAIVPALDQLLAQNANDTTTEAALARLFTRWNLSLIHI